MAAYTAGTAPATRKQLSLTSVMCHSAAPPCFQRLPVNPVYCRACAAVAFCSAACRSAADTTGGHQPGSPECGRMWPILLPTDVRLALRFAARLVHYRCCKPRSPPLFTEALALTFSGCCQADAHNACSAETIFAYLAPFQFFYKFVN